MFWSPEARSASWKVGLIVTTFISDSGKVNYNNFIANFLGLPAEDIIDLDVPISDLVLMQVLYCLANLNEDDAGDIPEMVGFILLSHVFNHLLIPLVALLKSHPVHNLTQSAQLVYSTDLIRSMDDLQTSRNVGVGESLENVQLVLKDVQTVGKLAISCKEPLFLKTIQRIYLHRQLLPICSHFHHRTEGSLPQLLHQLVLVVQFAVVLTVSLLELPCLQCESWQGWV